MTIDEVKKELPDVKVNTGLGMVTVGRLSGRQNKFATVRYCASLGLRIHNSVEVSWQTVTRAINEDRAITL